MARKYTNESYLSTSIDNQHDKQQEHSISKVKIPYFFKVTVREKIGESEVITKEPFPKEWDIVKIEPVKITFLNKCPKCSKEGRPRVDKKNNKDYTHYNKPSNREEYRLIYNHKQEDKKTQQCVIARFDKENGIFTKTGKISKKVEDYIFPNYLLNKKNI